MFKAKPDFEAPTDANKDNVYEVTVRAADGDGNRGEMAVKVTVENENEDGTVSLSRTQIRVGVAVTASLSDSDGSISGLTWQWSIDGANVQDATPNGDIEDANADTYIPKAGDVGGTLTATATYTDGEGPDPDGDDPKKTASVASATAVAVDTRNKAPVFEDQDAETDGTQNESTTRKVEENTAAVAADDALANGAEDTADNVGGVVTAEDPDPNTEAPIYTLGGADADKFRVRDNGQIEVGAGTKLDYETTQTYSVTVMAEDSFGESASIMVTITVTDVDEAPVISEGGVVISGMSSRDYAENGMDAVETYTASGPEAAMAMWSLSGDDAGSFSIDASGELTFDASPDYEAMADADGDNVYMVTVEADDGTYMDTHAVAVTVTDVNEAPEFASDTTTRSVAENTAAGENIGDPVSATDEDGDTLTYTLGGDDAASFDIAMSTGQLMTKTDLDFETDDSYTVTVTASDGTADATITVTITVTDVDDTEAPFSAMAYDIDGDGMEIDEVGKAILDFFAEDSTLTVQQVGQVILLYFDN